MCGSFKTTEEVNHDTGEEVELVVEYDWDRAEPHKPTITAVRLAEAPTAWYATHRDTDHSWQELDFMPDVDLDLLHVRAAEKIQERLYREADTRAALLEDKWDQRLEEAGK